MGTSSLAASPASSSSAPVPLQTQTGIPLGCTLYYTAVSGDDCDGIADDNGINVGHILRLESTRLEQIVVGYGQAMRTVLQVDHSDGYNNESIRL